MPLRVHLRAYRFRGFNLAIYYVNASGSSTAPFDTVEKAAVDFYTLIDSIGSIGANDTVNTSGTVVETHDWEWFLNEGLVTGEDPLVDKINMGTCSFYGGSGAFSHIGFFTDNVAAEYNALLYDPVSVTHCRFEGNGVLMHAIETTDENTPDVSYRGNIIEGCTSEAILVEMHGYYYDLYLQSENLTDRSYGAMALAPNGDVYALINGTALESKIHKFDGTSWATYGPATTQEFVGITVAPNGDIYVLSTTNVLCQSGGTGAFVEVLSDGELGAYEWGGITANAAGNVYIGAYRRLSADPPAEVYYVRINGTGNFVIGNALPFGTISMTSTPAGDVYALAKDGTLYGMASGGAHFTYINRTGLYETFATSITSDTSGNLYATNNTAAIFKWTGTGAWVLLTKKLIDGNIYSIKGSVMTGGGVLYVSNATLTDIAHSIERPAGPEQSFQISNNTISVDVVQTDPALSISVRQLNFTTLNVYNNIVVGAGVPMAVTASDTVANLFHKSNLCDDDFVYTVNGSVVSADPTELTLDPLFLGVEPDPFAIDNTSPCYRTGVHTSSMLDVDILGVTFANPPSMGAYEAGAAPADTTIRKRQEGDVKMYNTLDNGDINIVRGITETDGGLFNIVYLSLFCGVPGWWGDVGVSDSAYKYQSETGPLLQSIPAVSGNLRKIESAVLRDLEWIKSKKIATSITVSASIPAHGRVRIVINIDAGPDIEFIENWKASK